METLAPMNASSLLMVMRSRTLGILWRVTGSFVSSAAAIAGNAEFFAPLMATVPSSGLPPLIRNLSMRANQTKCEMRTVSPLMRLNEFRPSPLLTQRCTQMSFRIAQSFCCVSGVHLQFQHHQRHPQVVSRLTQSVFRSRQTLAAGVRQDAHHSLRNLAIRCFHIDHQVFINVSKARNEW